MIAISKKKTLYCLTNNKLIRAIFKPYKDYEQKKRYIRYLESKDSAYLKTLKNIHLGKRCFIVGNGPSLCKDDLDKLKEEITFGANRIFEIFQFTSWRPTYYLAVDPFFLKQNLNKLQQYNFQELFLASRSFLRDKNPLENMTTIFEVTKFAINKWNDKRAYISEDVSKGFSIGYTVTFTAIQLAIYMGFKEIYLIGVDFNYAVVRDSKGRIHHQDGVKDYFDNKKSIYAVLNFESALNAYNVAYNYCRDNNIKIKNATEGGKLEAFCRVNFKEIF